MSLLSWFKNKWSAAAKPASVTPPVRSWSEPAAVEAPREPSAMAPADDADGPTDAPEIQSEPATITNERRIKTRTTARNGVRALIIDDSPTIVAMLRKMLKQNGYETLEAGTAEDGLDIARTLAPDIIFLDIVLPQMDGFAALRHLRRDPGTRSIPVIMISGNEQAVEQFYVQRIGADDFMKKPFARAEVFARIEPLLDAEGVPRRRSMATT